MDVIGISGPPCSGKDVAAEYLSKFYGYKQISTGDLLREKAKVWANLLARMARLKLN